VNSTYNDRVIIKPKEIEMAKGKQKQIERPRSPKKEKIKTIAPSQKDAGMETCFVRQAEIATKASTHGQVGEGRSPRRGARGHLAARKFFACHEIF